MIARSTLILGGARSGKTSRALALCKPYAPRVYIATAEAHDDEMAARIAASLGLARRIHVSETTGVFMVAFCMLALLIGGGWLFGKQIMEQTTELWTALSEAWTKFAEFLAKTPFAATMVT